MVNRPMLLMLALALAFAMLAVHASNAAVLGTAAINQSAYNQTTTVPIAYRVIVGILLIVILVVLVWKALKYLIGAIFVIIILLMLASTAYYFFKTGSISIAYSLGFLAGAANSLARYLPIPSLYNSTIGLATNVIGSQTTTINASNALAGPYINGSVAAALMGGAISSSSFSSYSNHSSIAARFGNLFASNSTYAWLATYVSGSRNLTETVFLSNRSQEMYDYTANRVSPYFSTYNGIVNGMQYTYFLARNGSAFIPVASGLTAWKGSHLALVVAKNMSPNATALAGAVSSRLG